jgi:hypothetical protein
LRSIASNKCWYVTTLLLDVMSMSQLTIPKGDQTRNQSGSSSCNLLHRSQVPQTCNAHLSLLRTGLNMVYILTPFGCTKIVLMVLICIWLIRVFKKSFQSIIISKTPLVISNNIPVNGTPPQHKFPYKISGMELIMNQPSDSQDLSQQKKTYMKLILETLVTRLTHWKQEVFPIPHWPECQRI